MLPLYVRLRNVVLKWEVYLIITTICKYLGAVQNIYSMLSCRQIIVVLCFRFVK